MARYLGIHRLTFGQTPIALVLSVRLSRHCQASPAANDSDAFATSVQVDSLALAAEVRTRDTAQVENLSLGTRGDLSFAVADSGGIGGRQVTLLNAVLVGVELTYEQCALATATLRFMAEAEDGNVDPLDGEGL